MSKPDIRETIFLYLVASESVMRGALVREGRDVQKLVYYVSKSLLGAETRYQRMEKMVLALFVVSRKLKHYFQSFQIIVLMEHPLKRIIENLQATGQIAK